MTEDNRTTRAVLLTRLFGLHLEAFCKANGLPPGTLTVTPDKNAHLVAIEVVVPDAMPVAGEID